MFLIEKVSRTREMKNIFLVVSVSANILLNPSFEATSCTSKICDNQLDDVISPWYTSLSPSGGQVYLYSSNSTQARSVHEGNWSLSLRSETLGWGYTAFQNVSLNSAEYKLVFWSKLIDLNCVRRATGRGGQVLVNSSMVASFEPTSTTTWSMVSVSFTASAGMTVIGVSGEGCGILVDDFDLDLIQQTQAITIGVGTIVGAVFGFLLLMLAIIFYFKCYRRRRIGSLKTPTVETAPNLPHSGLFSRSNVSQNGSANSRATRVNNSDVTVTSRSSNPVTRVNTMSDVGASAVEPAGSVNSASEAVMVSSVNISPTARNMALRNPRIPVEEGDIGEMVIPLNGPSRGSREYTKDPKDFSSGSSSHDQPPPPYE